MLIDISLKSFLYKKKPLKSEAASSNQFLQSSIFRLIVSFFIEHTKILMLP